MHRPLAEVMVDPEDRPLVEGAEQDLVELLRGVEVAAERLLDDDACSAGKIFLYARSPVAPKNTSASD